MTTRGRRLYLQPLPLQPTDQASKRTTLSGPPPVGSLFKSRIVPYATKARLKRETNRGIWTVRKLVFTVSPSLLVPFSSRFRFGFWFSIVLEGAEKKWARFLMSNRVIGDYMLYKGIFVFVRDSCGLVLWVFRKVFWCIGTRMFSSDGKSVYVIYVR